MYWFYVATVLVVPVFSLRGNITSFTQNPSGILAPGAMVTYNCQAIGSDVTWFIDGVSRDISYSDYVISSNTISGLEHWNITVTTVASRVKNNTRILCYSNGRISGQVDRKFVNINVAGPPLTPIVMYEVMAEGTLLNISWEQPYSPEGFPIISYNLTLHDDAGSLLLWEDTPRPSFSILNSTDYSDNCTLLNFTVTASNSVGRSDEGFIAAGFPIFPQTDGLVIQSSFSLVDDGPVLFIEFRAHDVCGYQDPTNYTLEIVDDENRQIVASRGPKGVPQDHMVMEIFVSGINAHQTYEARLVISQNHFTRQVLLITNIGMLSSSDDVSTDDTGMFIPGDDVNTSTVSTGTSNDAGNHDLLIISMVSLGVALSVCVVLAITIATVCGCQKGIRRRPTMSEHIEIPLQTSPGISEFKLAPAPKGRASRVPTSLPPMAVNPIYDGPLYDSPGGESLKMLLGSPSVPNTPLGNNPLGQHAPMSPSAPMAESCRYFDMPPSLPPPRKVSVTARPHPLNFGVPEEAESNGVVKGEYTEMKPLSFAVACLPDVPPAVYEAMGGD